MRDGDDRSGRADQTDGQKTEDLSDLAGLLRSGDRRAFHEGGFGGLGRRQQPLPPGRGEGEPRSGRHRRDHSKARRRSEAPGWNRPTFQGTCRAAHRSCRRKTNKGGPQVERPKGEERFLSPLDKAAERKAALAYEREQARRQRERAREEAARQKDHERRQQAVDKARAALKRAEQEHAKRAAAIEAEVEALEKRSQAEKARWDKERERLEAALRRARG